MCVRVLCASSTQARIAIAVRSIEYGDCVLVKRSVYMCVCLCVCLSVCVYVRCCCVASHVHVRGFSLAPPAPSASGCVCRIVSYA